MSVLKLDCVVITLMSPMGTNILQCRDHRQKAATPSDFSTFAFLHWLQTVAWSIETRRRRDQKRGDAEIAELSGITSASSAALRFRFIASLNREMLRDRSRGYQKGGTSQIRSNAGAQTKKQIRVSLVLCMSLCSAICLRIGFVWQHD